MKTVAEAVLIILTCINLLLTRLALFRLHQPTTPVLWIAKVFISALSPILLLTGLLSAFLGVMISSWPTMIIGGLSALLYLIHIIKINQPEFYGNWNTLLTRAETLSPKDRRSFFLPRRYVFRLPGSPKPIVKRNISYYTIQDSNRELLCDIWQPSMNTVHSGLAFIYLHGSAWTVLDKDYGTRTFFRHLTAQGHVVMDVAYRLFPETDFMGMIYDTKHAIAWMKHNAEKYGVSPEKIVIGGGSAGAHLALLAAYTAKKKELTPADIENVDLNVRAVISLYGQSDLSAMYYHTGQHLTSRPANVANKKDVLGGMPAWIQKRMGEDFHRLGFDKTVEPGMVAPILGGTPDEKPEVYSLFSPISYVHGDCPPTLFLHGTQDILAPLAAILYLQARLTAVGVEALVDVLPQTDHAFDLILPKISPSAHGAYYDIERFLAVCANRVTY
jgi:acetyl esterase/lipase